MIAVPAGDVTAVDFLRLRLGGLLLLVLAECLKYGFAFTGTGKDLFMAYVITDECVMCGACVDVCPVSAIAEGDPKYVIDAGTCVDCGACAGECPRNAIVAG